MKWPSIIKVSICTGPPPSLSASLPLSSALCLTQLLGDLGQVCCGPAALYSLGRRWCIRCQFRTAMPPSPALCSVFFIPGLLEASFRACIVFANPVPLLSYTTRAHRTFEACSPSEPGPPGLINNAVMNTLMGEGNQYLEGANPKESLFRFFCTG